MDPMPSGRIRFQRPGPNQKPFRHASGNARPLRSLPDPLPAYGSFSPGTIVSYHRNNASEGEGVEATFALQGIESLYNSTPDYWVDRQSGFALDAEPGSAELARRDAHTVISRAPNTSFALRATVLAVQTDSVSDWMGDLAALLATAKPIDDARRAHEIWWTGFWARSHITVNRTKWPGPSPPPLPPPPPPPPPAPPASSLPVPGAILWLRASTLAATHTNGQTVNMWPEPALPGFSGVNQSNTSRLPTFAVNALGAGVAAVHFDGSDAFLANANLQLPGGDTGSTHFAVFRDMGSHGACCSGISYWHEADVGISTVPDTAGPGRTPSHIYVTSDGPGVGVAGGMDVMNRTVAATVTYGAGGVVGLAVESCNNSGTYPNGSPGPSRGGVMVGTRNNELGRYFKGYLGELITYPRLLNAAEVAAVRAYIGQQWPMTTAAAASSSSSKANNQCGGTGDADSGYKMSQMYALTRYTQAVQSRNTIWPIKFNGMAFIAAMGNDGSADSRQWGACNWWQNTRLPYGTMLAAGDYDLMQVILEYKLNQLKLLSQRTPLYWNHPGMWTTETSHLTGAYRSDGYGCSNREGYPVWLEKTGYLHVDQGGDSGTGEYSLMALDYLLWASRDPSRPAATALRYLPLAFEAAEYFMHHFNNRSADGRVVVWPAQVLETYWCTWNTTEQRFVNCCANDSPTVSGMIGLFDKLLRLPESLSSATQRAAWQSFADKLPLLPTTVGVDGETVIAPAQIVSNGTHNGEGPELYAIHPHRVFTKGRELALGLDISLAKRTSNSSSFGRSSNSGWAYAINAHALIGNVQLASKMLLERVYTPPAPGYRFPGFAPHEQDFDPSADHFANMNRALQDMLIQSGDDGFDNTTVVLLPTWPCQWDVSFKLWGPLQTSVQLEYADGHVQSLIVDPPERKSAVKFANCVSSLSV